VLKDQPGPGLRRVLDLEAGDLPVLEGVVAEDDLAALAVRIEVDEDGEAAAILCGDRLAAVLRGRA
jgi:hypothetical protein